MRNVTILDYEQADELFQAVIRSQTPAILSYLSRNKWHVAKVVIRDLSGLGLRVEPLRQGSSMAPLNIQEGQPVGLSFKYSYAKFVADTTVHELLPGDTPGGQLMLSVPDQVIAIQRRSYFRVSVPSGMQVRTVLWPRRGSSHRDNPRYQYCEGILVDLSCGGAQIAIPNSSGSEGDDRPRFREGQFIGVRFTPLPYEQPLLFDAQIRTILPTADEQALCLGLQLVGLEASDEGRETLKRIAHIVERYYEMNQQPTATVIR